MRNIFAAVVLLFIISSGVSGQQALLQEGLALKYLVRLPADGSKHPPLIILLHGYGSDEKDLFELRTSLPASYMIIAARAPYALPGGGYQWYDISATSKGKGDIKRENINGQRDQIIQFISQVAHKYKADSSAVYLIGFSQGAIMSYEVGLYAPDKVKGIGVLSGRLYESLKPVIKNTPALKKLKIFIAHGTADNRIPFVDGKAANDYLTGIGLKPDFHQYSGMSHTISNDVMNDLLKWLNK